MAVANQSEGMVAIVTGLQDAGLSVAVRDGRVNNGQQRNESMRCTPMRSQGLMPTVSSGVQTSSPPERSRSSTQIVRPSPYLSSYQRAYGGGSRGGSPSPPTSPTRATNTIDIQRLNEQLNELRASLYSNGQNASNQQNYTQPPSPTMPSQSAPIHLPTSAPHHLPADIPTRQPRMTPVRDMSSYRNSHHFDRAKGLSPSSTRRDLRISDTFAESLRKYPSSTDRTASADIIQRLLAYTQSKNAGSRRSFHTKRVRSLTQHSQGATSSQVFPCSTMRSNKNLQTYTRCRNESPVQGYGKTERRRRVISPVKSEREGSPSSPETMSYDYLKIGSFSPRTTDVRYLNDVTRYVKDTLRLVINNDEVLCPQMLDRYSSHRREHHQTETGTLTVQEIDQFAQTSGGKPGRPKRVCRFSDLPADRCTKKSKKMSDSIKMKMIEIREKLCVICNQPQPCRCETPPCPCPENRPITFKDRLKSLDICEEIRRIYTQEPLYETCTCPQDVDELIEDAVDQWLRDIPIYAGYTLEEKATRDQIVKELKDNLKEHLGDQLKSKDVIMKCLKDLPMWLPPDKTDQDKFMENLANDLLRMTLDIDVFDDRVRKWVRALPFLSNIIIDKDKLVVDLAKKLKDTAMTTKNLKNDLKAQACEEIENLPLNVCSCVEREALAEKLAESLASLPAEVIDSLKHSGEFSYVRKQVEFIEKIKKWVYRIPFDPTACVDREALTSEFTQELLEIIRKTESGALWETVKGYVQKKLLKMPVQGGYGEVAHQSAKLADQLISDMFSEIVLNWAKNIAFDYDSNVVPDLFAHDLTRKLAMATKNLDPEEAEDTLRDMVFEELNRVPASGSLPLKVSQAGKLAHALSKLGPKDTKKIKDAVELWIKEVPFAPEPAVDKSKVATSLAQHIKDKISTTKPEDTWAEIRNVTLEEIRDLPVKCGPQELEQLTEKLADIIVTAMFDDAVLGWAKAVPFNTESMVDVDAFAKELNKRLKDVLTYEDPERVPKRVKDTALEMLVDDQVLSTQEEKSKLGDDLVDTMNNAPHKRDQVAVIVGNWIKKVPTKSAVPRLKVKDFVRKLKEKIRSTSSKHLWNATKVLTMEELEHLQTDCLTTEMENLAENLANSLVPGQLEEIVKDWANGIEFENKSDEVRETFTKDVTDKLKVALSGARDEYLSDNMKNIIIEELNMAPVSHDHVRKDKEAEKLLKALQCLCPIRDKILLQVEKWIRRVPFKLDTPVNKIKVTKELANKISTKLESEPDDIWYALKDITQETLEKLPVNADKPAVTVYTEGLADMILTHLLNEILMEIIKKVPFDPVHMFVDRGEIVDNLVLDIENLVPLDDKEAYKEVLNDLIVEKFKLLPLMCTSAQEEELVNEMATKIAELPRRPDQFSQTVREWTKTVPFQIRPPIDKNKFAVDLTQTLRHIILTEPPEHVRGAIKNETIEELKKFNLKCSDNERAKLADNLADLLISSLFTDTVGNWLRNVQFKPNAEKTVDKPELGRNLVRKLKPYFAVDDPDKKEMAKIVNDELAPLEIEGNVDEMGEDLIGRLMKLPVEKGQHLVNKFAVDVNNWLKGITVSLGTEENEKLVRKTLDKLRKLRLEGKDEAVIREELKHDIRDGVNKILEGQTIDPEAKKNLAKKLYNQVFDTVKYIAKERKQVLLPKFKESIKSWWAEHPDLSSVDKKVYDKVSQDLAYQLTDEAVGGGNQTHIKNKITKLISGALDTVDRKFRHNAELKNKLTISLSDRIAIDMGIFAAQDTKKLKINVPNVSKDSKESKSKDIKEEKDTKEKVKTESQFRVEAIKRNESETSFETRNPRQRSISLSDGNSDLKLDILDKKGMSKHKRSKNTNTFDEYTREITAKNKSMLVKDLIDSLTELSPQIHKHQRMDSPEVIERKLNKQVENISELSSTFSELSKRFTKTESNQIQKETQKMQNESVEDLDVELEHDNVHLKSLTKQLLDQLTEQSSSSSESDKDEMNLNYSKSVKENSSQQCLSGMKKIGRDNTARSSINKRKKTQEQDLNEKIADELVNIYDAGKSIRSKHEDKVLNKLGKTMQWMQSVSSSQSYKNYKNTSGKYLKKSLNDNGREMEGLELKNHDPPEGINARKECRVLTKNVRDIQHKGDAQEFEDTFYNTGKNLRDYKNQETFHDTDTIIDEETKTENFGMWTSGVESTINTVLYSYPTSEEELVKILDKALEKDVINLIESVPVLSSNTLAERKELEKLCKCLTQKLTKIVPQDFNKKQNFTKLQKEIVEKIDDILECKGKQLNIKTKYSLANHLLDMQAAHLEDKSYKSKIETTDVSKNFAKHIKEWMDNIPELSSRNHIERREVKKVAEALTRMLNQIEPLNLDNYEVRRKLVDEIKDKLDAVLKIRGSEMENKVKQILANQLLDNLNEIKTSTSLGFCLEDEKQHNFVNVVEENIEEWAKTIPRVSGKIFMGNSFNIDKITHNLCTEFVNLQSQNIDSKQMKKKMASRIIVELDNTYDKNINVAAKNKLVKDLMDKLLKTLDMFDSSTCKKQSRRTSLSPEKEQILEEFLNFKSKHLTGESRDRKDMEELFFKLENIFKKDVIDWLEDYLELKMKSKKGENSKYSSGLRAETKYPLEIQQHTEKEIKVHSVNSEDCDRNTKLSDKLLYNLEGSAENAESISTIAIHSPKTVKEDIKIVIEDRPLLISNNITVKDKNYILDEEDKIHMKMCSKINKNIEASSSEDKKIDVKTRRSLTNLLIERLADSTSSIDVLAIKALHNDVKTWFDDIPELQGINATEKAKNKKLLRDLTKRLANLKSENLEEAEFLSKMAQEIKGKLDFASKGKNLNSKTKDKLVNELLDKIMDTIGNHHGSMTSLKDVIISSQNTKRILKELLPDMFLDKHSDKRELDRLSKHLTSIFNNLQAYYIENKTFRNKILSIIKDQIDAAFDSTDKYLPPKRKHIVAENLLDSVVGCVAKGEKITDLSKVFQKDILSWLEDIPETASSSAGERKANIKSSFVLARKLAGLYSSGLDDKEMKKEVLEEIKEHLEEILERKGEVIKSNKLYKLANKLVNNISIFPGPFLKKVDHQESVIWEWASEIPMLAKETTLDKRRRVNELSKILYKIQNKGIASDMKKFEMRKEINKWLKEISSQKKKRLDDYTKHNYVSRLVENMHLSKGMTSKVSSPYDMLSSIDIRMAPRPGSSKDYGVCTESMLLRKSVGQFNIRPSEVFFTEDSQSVEISREINPSTQAKIFGLITHNIDAMDVPAETEILRTQIMKILMDEAGLPESEASGLTKAILENARQQALNAGADEKQLLMLLRQELRRIMGDYPIDEKNKDMVEAFLMDLEVRRLFEGESYDDAKEEILKLIKEKGGLSDEDAIKMLGRLGGNYDCLLNSPAVNKSLKRIKSGEEKGKDMSLEDDYTFEVRAMEILNDFFKENVVEPSPEKERRIKNITAETVSNLEDLLDPKDDINENVERMRQELNKQLRKISLDTYESITDLAEGLVEKLKDAYLKTSTPKKRPSRKSVTGSSIVLDEDGFIISPQVDQYRDRLDDIIGTWLDDLPIDSYILDDPQFKDSLIKDLRGTVMDREKYLQLNPDVRTSEAEEKEFLKDQAQKWLQKFLDGEDLNTAMAMTDDLVDAIKGVPVPKIAVDPSMITGGRMSRSGRSSMYGGKLPTYHDALQDEILGWVAGLPPNQQPTVDDNTLRQHVKDLANKIEKHKGKPDAEEKIRTEIASTFPSIFDGFNDAELKGLENDLFNKLMKKGFTDDTWDPRRATGKVPTYNDALQEEILGWAAHLPPNKQPTVDDDTLRKHVRELAKRIEKHKGKPDAEEKIRGIIADMLPLIFEGFTDADIKELGSSLFNELMKKGFTDDTWVPPGQQGSEFIEQKLTGALKDWLSQSPMYQKASPEEKKQMELATIEMAKGIKKAVSIAKMTPGTDMDEAIRDEIMKHVKNLIQDPALKNDEEFLNQTTDTIANFLKGQKMYNDLIGKSSSGTSSPPDLLTLAIDDWARKLPIDLRTPEEQERFNENKKNLVSRLKQARNQFHPSTSQHEQAIKDEARKFLRANITDPNKRFDEKYIEEMANKLIKQLHSVPIEQVDPLNIKPYKSPADTLYEYIEEWVKNLPVQGTPEKVNEIKQNLASKLVNKIGELNLNPDVFNDASVYQDLLQDEIDTLLDEIPGNPELNKYLPALKKDLISKIMDARQRMIEELAGKFYKQHLRDKISTSLPLPSALTLEEQASLELLKDKLADAFINLHYATCDEAENLKYKGKIANELTKFCNNIFRHYPCARFDTDKLKTDLHKALVRVPVPRDDAMKSEVEQVRIRDIIYDWMRKIPLRQETATEKLHRYKLAAVLAKRIHDIEMEKQSNDFIDAEHKIGEEITRFLNKLLIRQDQEHVIPELVQKLMNALQYSEQSRRFISSSKRCQPNESGSTVYSRYPCTLSNEDQDHLKRIRARRQQCKDVGVCPPLTNTCSQTDQTDQCYISMDRSSGVKRSTCTSQKYCEAIPFKKNAACMTPKASPCHLQPRVVVKEYIWDSPDSCKPADHKSKNTQGCQTTPPPRESTCPLNAYPSPMAIGPSCSPFNPFPPSPSQMGTCIPQATSSLICNRPSLYGTFSPYAPLQQQPYQSQPPVMTDRPSQNPCYCPPFQEREIPYSKVRPYAIDDDDISSEDECQAGPSRTCRRQNSDYRRESCEDVKKSCGRSRYRWVGHDDEVWNPCWRHRSRRQDVLRSDSGKDKCNCKDRIFVSCKGHGNRFMDMCQACGKSCPHPRSMFFK